MDESDAPSRMPKLRKDGEIDGRGHSEQSKPTRFALGDGRRRPGRPKGAISMKTAYLRAAAMSVHVTDKRTNKRKTYSTPEGIALRQRELALKGDHKATQRFEARLAEYCPEEVDATTTAKLLEEDRLLLEMAASRGLIASFKTDKDKDNA